MDPEIPAPGQPHQPPSTDPECSEPNPTCTKRGNGKVARLPEEIREQISQMIEDGVPYKDIIQTLGEPTKHLSEDNIKNWKTGKHKLWLAHRERKEDLAETRDAARGLVKIEAGIPVQDASRSIAAAQMYELLLAFEPSAFAAALVEKPELYLKLVNALSRLCEGEAACTHRRAMQSLIQSKLGTKSDEAGKKSPSKEDLQEIVQHIKLV